MVFRSDISVDWNTSPRLIFVAAPSTSLTIQDLVDTLRFLEERPWEGLPHPQILAAAGKESLGGILSVGITAKLLNARLAFEGRKNDLASGTITTPDTNGIILTDNAATFISNNVNPGAWIINLTDGSKASVLKVNSQTQLITDNLAGGNDNQFNTNDSYKVQNIVQCELSGGNLVAVDTDGITPIPAILSTIGTQINRTASSSATLVTGGSALTSEQETQLSNAEKHSKLAMIFTLNK